MQNHLSKNANSSQSHIDNNDRRIDDLDQTNFSQTTDIDRILKDKTKQNTEGMNSTKTYTMGPLKNDLLNFSSRHGKEKTSNKSETILNNTNHISAHKMSTFFGHRELRNKSKAEKVEIADSEKYSGNKKIQNRTISDHERITKNNIVIRENSITMKKDNSQQHIQQQSLKQPRNTFNATDIQNKNSGNDNGYNDKVESSTKQRTKSLDNTIEGTKSASTNLKYNYANHHQGILSQTMQPNNKSVKKDDNVTSLRQTTINYKNLDIDSYKKYAPTQTEVAKMKPSMSPQSTKTLTIMMNMTKQTPQDKRGGSKKNIERSINSSRKEDNEDELQLKNFNEKHDFGDFQIFTDSPDKSKGAYFPAKSEEQLNYPLTPQQARVRRQILQKSFSIDV